MKGAAALAACALLGAVACGPAAGGSGPDGETNALAIPDEAEGAAAANGAGDVFVSQGVLDLGLGEPIADTVAHSTFDVAGARSEVPQFGSFGKVDLKVRFRGRQFDFGRIGGGHDYPWTVEESIRGSIEAVTFFYQDGTLLTLAEAMQRARTLRAWLEAGGFVPVPRDRTPEGMFTPGPFEVMDFDRDNLHARDWAGAAAMLTADRSIGGMHLYTLHLGDYRATVEIDRIDPLPDEEERALPPSERGRDWQIQVRLGMPPLLIGEINHPERGPPEAVLSPADQLPGRAEAARALVSWMPCTGEGCPGPRRDTILTALRCRPDAIFRGDPVKVICHLAGHYRLQSSGREPLLSDCYYFWRGQSSREPWAVLAVPDAEFCEE